MLLFDLLVGAHIVTGAVGLTTLWVPVLGRKGGADHRRFGRIFVRSLLATGCLALGISVCSLIAPLETHPFADDPAQVRGVFGWMMLYLAVFTINLSLYGRDCVRNRARHGRNRNPRNLALQAATSVLALNCAWQGWRLGEGLLVGIALVGLVAAVLFTRFILTPDPPANEWLVQHTRGLVGAGISVYTAFFAFGAVNFMPALAFNPGLWATPCTLGVGYLVWHQLRIRGTFRRLAVSSVPRDPRGGRPGTPPARSQPTASPPR